MTKVTNANLDYYDIQAFLIPAGQFVQQPLHRHPETVELLMVLEGHVQCTIENNPYMAPAGTVLTIEAGMWHQQVYAASEQQSGYKLSVSRSCQESSTLAAALPAVHPIEHEAFQELKALFMQLHRELMKPRAQSHSIVHHLIGLILALVQRSADSRPSPTQDFKKTINEIKHYIEENHCHSLTLETISRRFSLNKYQLARLFKHHTGISLLQFIISCRLDAAKQLLATTDSSVNGIATATGYKSNTQFQAAFKKATALTPRQYRLAHKANDKG